MKTVLAIEHGQIPPSLHYTTPNPHIAWDDLPVRVPTAETPWPASYDTRIGGVSSFGISGTNAHLVVEEAPALTPRSVSADRPLQILSASAKSSQALQTLARHYAHHLETHPDESLAEFCHTVNTGRAHLSHRLAIVAATAAEAQEKLLAASIEDAGQSTPRTVGFLFTGQGGQYAGMGRELYEREPAFRAGLDRCAALLEPLVDIPLLDILADDSLLEQTRYAQPALVAFEWALAELWKSWGIQPAAVLGHSVGECAAACVAGILSLPDALHLAAARGRLMEEAARGGSMAAVFAGPEVYEQSVTIAAMNAPAETVIAGTTGSIDTTLAELSTAGIRSRKLPMPYAFHSPLLDPILDDLESEASSLTYGSGTIPMVSGLTGDMQVDIGTAGYWRRQAREPVRFADAVTTLRAGGCDTFIEIGPNPILIGAGRRTVDDDSCLWLPSLKKGRPDVARILESVASLYTAGVTIDWVGIDGDCPRRVGAPTYPFQRERYWMKPAVPAPAVGPATVGLLGHPLSSPALKARTFENVISASAPPVLADHRIYGTVVVPAAAFVVQALEASGASKLAEFSISEALVLPPGEQRTVQVIHDEADESPTVRIYSRQAASAPETAWTLHATARVSQKIEASPLESRAAIQARCSDRYAAEEIYSRARDRHIDFGPAFRCLDEIWHGDGEVLARLSDPIPIGGETIAPGLIDVCFQLVALASPPTNTNLAVVPTGFDGLEIHHMPRGELWAHATASGLVQITDPAGIVLEMVGARLRQVPAELLKADSSTTADWLHRVAWEPEPASAAIGHTGRWLVVSQDRGLVTGVCSALGERGAEAIGASPSDEMVERDVHGILYLMPSDLREALHLLQAARSPVLVVTRGAQRVGMSSDPVDPMQAALWGFARSVAQERPELWGGLLDLDPGATPDTQIEEILSEVGKGAASGEAARRDGRRFVPRVTARPDQQPASPLRLRSDATYLISGGFGGLGLQVAQRFVDRGTRHLVLLGRAAPSDDASSRVESLRRAGIEVREIQADISDDRVVADLIDDVASTMPPLRGIIHAAGVLDDRILQQQSWERFENVLVPKVAGAWNLHAHTTNLPLDFFVLFSSLASVFGSPGQSAYAAANAYMDGLAHYRAQLGLPATSINWAPWSDVGMAAANATRRGNLERHGLSSLSVDRGLDLLERILQSGWTQVVTVAPGWQRGIEPESPEIAAFRSRLLSAPESRRDELLANHVRDQVTAVLGLPEGSVFATTAAFFDLGLDSMTALDLRNRLQRSLGLALPPTLVLEYGTADDLASHLAALLFDPEIDEPPIVAADDDLDEALLAEIEMLSEDALDRELDVRAGGL